MLASLKCEVKGRVLKQNKYVNSSMESFWAFPRNFSGKTFFYFEEEELHPFSFSGFSQLIFELSM